MCARIPRDRNPRAEIIIRLIDLVGRVSARPVSNQKCSNINFEVINVFRKVVLLRNDVSHM